MNAAASRAAAGAAGAITTTVLHEATRHLLPNAPRVDLLGMQGIARVFPRENRPAGKPLFGLTLAADLVSNAAYYSFVGAKREQALRRGAVLGLAAGIGAVVLPGPMGLDQKTTARTPLTALLSIALYTAGGIVAGAAYSKLVS